jgi:hypothetical protein
LLDAQPGACLDQLGPGGEHRCEVVKLANHHVIPGMAQPGRCFRRDLNVADQHDVSVGRQYRASAFFETSPQADADCPAHMAGSELGGLPAVEQHRPGSPAGQDLGDRQQGRIPPGSARRLRTRARRRTSTRGRAHA